MLDRSWAGGAAPLLNSASLERLDVLDMGAREGMPLVLSCSGEEEPEGTIARNAVRLVMEKYRPGITVSLCLPLSRRLAGRSFPRDSAPS